MPSLIRLRVDRNLTAAIGDLLKFFVDLIHIRVVGERTQTISRGVFARPDVERGTSARLPPASLAFEGATAKPSCASV